MKNKVLTEDTENRLQSSLQEISENKSKNIPELTPELAKIIDRWPTLSEHIKAAILTLAGIEPKTMRNA